jgi:hypothetical protein
MHFTSIHIKLSYIFRFLICSRILELFDLSDIFNLSFLELTLNKYCRGVEVKLPVGARDFSLLHMSRLTEAPPAEYAMDTRSCFPGG